MADISLVMVVCANTNHGYLLGAQFLFVVETLQNIRNITLQVPVLLSLTFTYCNPEIIQLKIIYSIIFEYKYFCTLATVRKIFRSNNY